MDFVSNVYINNAIDYEYTFLIHEAMIDLEYNSENNELVFKITFDDEMSKEYHKNCSKAAEFLCDMFKKSNINIEYSTFDGFGESFLDLSWTIKLCETNENELLSAMSDIEKAVQVFEKKQDFINKKKKLIKNGYRPIKRNVKFRPKARLLSILGEQLISNEIIAIKELVLNSFDADAKNVYISFNQDSFGKVKEITILDDGCGMSEETIINGWFTPATSIKTKEKKLSTTPELKRPIMGEKGVGRFACRRLGESLDVTTRTKGSSDELFYNIEWSQYDVDEDDIYLDNIDNIIYSKPYSIPQVLISPSIYNFESGTLLRIANLRDNWDTAKISSIKTELLKLTLPFQKVKEFKIYINNEELQNNLFLEKAKFYMEGVVDTKGNLYYIIGTYPREHSLKPGELINSIDFSKDISIEEQLSQLTSNILKDNLLDSRADPKAWSMYIKNNYEKKGIARPYAPQCGNFTFTAYAWDLDIKSKKKVGINDASSKEILKNFCGISIYRDGFRVWPYGASGNDWLDLDQRAEGGEKPFHISNKQVIGYVGISQKDQPYFKDKTNREGFIESTIHFEDFKKLILISFSHLESLRHKNNSKESPPKDKEWWQKDKVLDSINTLEEQAKNKAPELLGEIASLKKIYTERKIQTEDRITNLLEVSSTGVVYESVTHELISFLLKMHEQSGEIDNFLNTTPANTRAALDANVLLKEALKIVLFEVKELQPYFKAARYQLKELNIKEISEKAMKYFKYKLNKNSVRYKIIELSPMKRKAVEGFILQIFTNLIDNTIYWLDYDNNTNKEILITIDGNKSVFYFSDNGKGIDQEDTTYVFEAFFSRKVNEDGTRGRGLGLYIVQELLSNYRGSISIVEDYKPEGCTEKRRGTSFKIYIP